MDKEQGNIPTHVAVIMDGNGRWAKQRSLDRVEGHRRGVDALRAVVTRAANSGVRYLTVYAFSTENWGRPVEEVRGIMELLGKVILSEAIELAKNKVRLCFIGNTEELSSDLQKQIEQARQIEIDKVKMVFTVALNYSARWDIARAAQRIAQSGCREVDERVFAENLSTAGLPDVDLVIRTSGEQRLSNFLLWESSYAELYFTETLWPDFDEARFDEAIEWFAARNRRYGLTDVTEVSF